MSRRYDLAPELQRTFADFLINLGRVENLIKVYEASSGRGRGRKTVLDADVLRAAVVFAHAALISFGPFADISCHAQPRRSWTKYLS